MERRIHLKSVITCAILLIVIILLSIFLIRTISNFIIISRLNNLSKQYINFNNYYIRTTSYSDETININESYNQGEKQLITVQIYGRNINETRKIINYLDTNSSITLIQSGSNKVALDKKENIMKINYLQANLISDLNFWNKLLLASTANIQFKDDTYIIKLGDELKEYIDSTTGLTKRIVNGNTVSDKFYEFNQVTDADVAKPDMTGYIIQENN